MKNKIFITIKKDRYHPDTNEGKEFTAVDYHASSYGGGHPCDSKEEVAQAVKHAQEVIREAGDFPVIDNKLETASLGAWLQ